MRSKSTRTVGSSVVTRDSIAMPRDSAKPRIPSTAISTKSSGRCSSRSRWMWPASILEMSRMLLMSRMSRSVFLSEMSTRWRWVSSSTRPASESSRWSDPLMEVSGVRSSCETVETNSVFMRSISRSRVTSRRVMVVPTTAPSRSRVGVVSQRRVRRSGRRTSRSPSAGSPACSTAVTRARPPVSSHSTDAASVSISRASGRPVTSCGSTPSRAPPWRFSATTRRSRSSTRKPSEVEAKTCSRRVFWFSASSNRAALSSAIASWSA